jgi:hypothetical protein
VLEGKYFSRYFLVNANIIVSNPHFYGAAKEIRQMFPYIKQDPNQDQTTLDIEPVSTG